MAEPTDRLLSGAEAATEFLKRRLQSEPDIPAQDPGDKVVLQLRRVGSVGLAGLVPLLGSLDAVIDVVGSLQSQGLVTKDIKTLSLTEAGQELADRKLNPRYSLLCGLRERGGELSTSGFAELTGSVDSALTMGRELEQLGLVEAGDGTVRLTKQGKDLVDQLKQ